LGPNGAYIPMSTPENRRIVEAATELRGLVETIAFLATTPQEIQDQCVALLARIDGDDDAG
jgi:hypothetical protein